MQVATEITDSATPKRKTRKSRKTKTESSAAELKPTSMVSDTKRSKSMSLRIDRETQCLIDRAAEALGQNRTEFLLSTAREKAVEVLLDKKFFVLEESDWNSFLNVLDNPPPANKKLKSILSNTPPWESPAP